MFINTLFLYFSENGLEFESVQSQIKGFVAPNKLNTQFKFSYVIFQKLQESGSESFHCSSQATSKLNSEFEIALFD